MFWWRINKWSTNFVLVRKQLKSGGLIAVTSPIILLKFDSNHQFFSPCDLEIWWMTLKNNRAHPLYYVKFCASFQSHQWIQTGVAVWKPSIWVKIGDFFVPCDLKIWRRTWKKGHFSIQHQALCIFSKPSVTSNLSYSPEMFNSGQHRWFFVACDLEIWQMTLKNNRSPLLCHIKLCAWFNLYMWIHIGVTVQKRLNWVLAFVTLTFDLDLLHGHHFCQW